MTEAPSPVFVSYARPDEAQARAVVRRLEEAGHVVWWDGLIQGGEGWSSRIADALDRACAIVVLWSEAARASNWVKDEAQSGADRGRLVPVSLDGELPPLGFRQFQTIAYENGRAPAMERIVAAVATAAGTGPATPRPIPKGPNRRALLVGGAGAALAAAGAAAWYAGLFAGKAPARSIAVLPFDTIDADPGKAYFADGVAAEIRAALSRNPRLQVVANTSSNALGHASGDARAIARQLDVAYLLDGNVRRVGERVRVAAELIDAASGYSAWSRTFDRPAADVFAVQDEIAGAVAEALSVRLAGRPDTPTVSLPAYDAYLQGRRLYEQASGEADDRGALAAFEKAVALDPNYADAHAARARALAVIANQYAQGPARHDLYAQSVAAAQRAVALAPDSASAQSALGFALFYGRLDFAAAETAYRRSAELGGGDADVLSRFALFLTRTGRFDEARAALQRARALDPLNARIDWLGAELELDARRPDQAIMQAKAALARNPRIAAAHAAIGTAYLLQSNAESARAAFAAESNTLFRLSGLAIALKRLGRDVEAQAALKQLQTEHGDNGLYQQAQVFAQWGDVARAIATLTQAREQGDAGVTHVKTDPLLDPLRRDPRFIALQRALGLA